MIYLTSSLRHARVREVAAALRAHRLEVFDDWHAAGPEADDIWQRYEQERGHTFREALKGKHATNVFEYDKRNLDASRAGVLVMPAGRSANREIGYLSGQGKPVYTLFESEPERWDIMEKWSKDIYYDLDELVRELTK